jgi:hypothetical protein
MNPNRATRPARIPRGSRASNPPHLGHERTASPAGHGSRASDRAFLIATLPRIEIAITHSFKRRKHFLIATRSALSGASPSASFQVKIGRAHARFRLPLFTTHQLHLREFNPQGSNASLSACKQRRWHFLPYGKLPSNDIMLRSAPTRVNSGNQARELHPFPQYPYGGASLSRNIALTLWRIA